MPGPMRKGAKGAVEKPKDFKKTTIKLVNNYISKYKIALIVVFIFSIGSAIFNIVGPKILGNATTEIYTGLVSKLSGGEGINFEKIGAVLIWLLVLYITSALFAFAQGFVMTNVAQKLTYKLRNDIVIKINKLPMKYFDKRTHG